MVADNNRSCVCARVRACACACVWVGGAQLSEGELAVVVGMDISGVLAVIYWHALTLYWHAPTL